MYTKKRSSRAYFWFNWNIFSKLCNSIECPSLLKNKKIPYSCFGFVIFTIFIVMFYYILHLRSTITTLIEVHRFPQRTIIFWSNDFHISPIRDVKNLLSKYNVRFIDKSLSGHCSLTKSCAKDLKILNQENGIAPSLQIKQQFYETYKNDSEMNLVDVFICFHPVGMCELFMPFNRTIIAISSTRYELGRHGPEEWTNLNKNLQIIASNPRNVIAGNNLYDAEYIRYFTGIEAIVLPSLCDYTNATYTPKQGKPFLIASMYKKNVSLEFVSILNDTLKRFESSITIGHLREVYSGHYEYSQIAEHPGFIYIPYQVSLMSLFEQYRMNIPLFFPSLDLLTEWQYLYQVVNERTWDGISGKRSNGSRIPSVLNSDIPDPNNEQDRNAIRYWLTFSDFYQWPHIIYFNSTEQLATKLITTNLTQVSQNMNIYNQYVKKTIHYHWHQILDRITQL